MNELLSAGVCAVKYAARLSYLIQEKFQDVQLISKKDLSPVTAADYGAQAVISLILFAHNCPCRLLGEEESITLALDENKTVLETVVNAVNEIYPHNIFFHQCSSRREDIRVPHVVLPWTAQDIIDAIKMGNINVGEIAENDFWVLDPIDGTKGFLRRGQYAIGLAFLRDNVPIIGIIASPKLPFFGWEDAAGEVPFLPGPEFIGSLFTASLGNGAYVEPLISNKDLSLADDVNLPPRRIHTSSTTNTADIVFTESYESEHTNRLLSDRLFHHLHIQKDPIRIDSMSKFGLLAQGDVQLLMRLKTAPEMIWDQAPGNLIVTEAGGVVTDGNGHPLDFSTGKTLTNNKRVIVSANRSIHDKVIEALQIYGQVDDGL